MTDLLIRHYNDNPKDEQEIMDLLEEIRSSGTSDISFYLMDSNYYKANYLKLKLYIFLIAKKDDKIIGFTVAEHYTNSIVNILLTYVGNDYRRQGVSFALKNALEKLATLRGYKQIISQVLISNTVSIALNEKSGWIKEIDKVYPDFYFWFTKNLKH